MSLFYRLQMKFAKVMFLHLSVSHSVHRRACMAGDVHGGVVHGAWVVGGMGGRGRAWWGACVVGACMAGAMHGGGHVWQGGMCGMGEDDNTPPRP